MNVEIGTLRRNFFPGEYLFRIFGIVSLQYTVYLQKVHRVVLPYWCTELQFFAFVYMFVSRIMYTTFRILSI